MADANPPFQDSGMLDSVTSLTPNKRYILTHDMNGKSIVHSAPPQLYWGVPGMGGVARSFATSTIPVTLNNDEDINAYLSKDSPTSYTARDIVVQTKQSSNLMVVELSPGATSPMHRTVSIDYIICTNGHVRMELDTGEFVDLHPGDHVIQRGTNHAWHNGSQTEPARLVAVALPLRLRGDDMLSQLEKFERAQRFRFKDGYVAVDQGIQDDSSG